MPTTPHAEKHFQSGPAVRDVVIGMADGLTVPFALAAGLTGAIQASSLVVTAGLAEIAAGAIAMGLGGYLAARSDVEHYASERRREEIEIREKLDVEKNEVDEIFRSYGLAADESRTIVEALARRPEAFVDFMMRFELGLERPDPSRARRSALTIASAYICGGLIPLAPYFFLTDSRAALVPSIVLTGIALFVFGWVKGRFVGTNNVRSALQTVAIGGLAAGTAYAVATLISSH